MRLKLLSLLLLFFIATGSALAAEGDTTHIRVHDKMDITWYGSYDSMGYFPVSGTEYHKVLMKFTLGCASTGCSHWDYNVHIRLMDPTGVLDSNITSYDTLSHMPLMLDTNWNVFEVLDPYELGQVITPYGTYMDNGSNGFDNNWEHRYLFDVTDFVHLLEDSAHLRAFFSGWSSGFAVTLDFYFIEGTPYRDVLGIENVYTSGGGYSTAADFNDVRTPPQNINVPAATKHTKVRVTPSGHGFDNDVNCAEFCPKDYHIIVNGSNVVTNAIWNEDCGINPVYPQGGTWIFDRANWCPGSKTYMHEHEVSHVVTPGIPNVFDFDVESYTWSGTQTPSYALAMQTVFYGEHNFQLDAELSRIVAPSTHEENLRFNPMCDNPIVEIKNTGELVLTELEIKYWVEGGQPCWYTWTGSLQFGESEQVTLPIFDWSGLDDSKKTFHAEISWPNNWHDEYSFNNAKSSKFELPPMYSSSFEFWFRTNSRVADNEYFLYDEAGNVLKHFIPSAANTLYKDTFALADGCYLLEVIDHQKDGMNDWPLSQGNGTLQLRNHSGSPIVIKTLQRDFGTSLRHWFMVGYDLGDGPGKAACNQPAHPTSINEAIDLNEVIDVYPNPTDGIVNVNLSLPVSSDITIKVTDVMGKEIQQIVGGNVSTEQYEINLENKPAGIYLIDIQTKYGTTTQKVVLNK